MRRSSQSWPHRPLGVLATIQSGGTPDRKNSAYWVSGKIPWVTTAEVNYSLITDTKEKVTPAGLANSSAKIFPKGTILMALYGQGKTRGQVGLLGIDASSNQACASIQPKSDLNVGFLYEYLKASYAAIRRLSNSGGQQNLSSALISEMQIPIPPLPEQRKIAEILRTWDEAIEKLEALRAAKQKRLDGLTHALIFGKLRMNGQRRNWRPMRLSEVTFELTARNANLAMGHAAVMGVTKAQGIVPMREQTIGGDLSRYKRLPPRAFAYNPMRINVGSIAMSNRDEEVLVSPDYVVFGCTENGLAPDFLNHLRKTHWWSHHINIGGSGSVRMRTYYDDLAAMKLPLPAYKEQLEIVAVLNTAQEDVKATEKASKALTCQKRGLTQKLLTGEWRVKV